MDQDEYYRLQAADAQEQSDKSINDADKSSWLRIAQSWMQMVKKPAPTAAQSFDDETK